MKRRTVLLAGAAGAAAFTLLARPRDRGGDHAPYFRRLAAALDAAGTATPTLIVDRARLAANLDTLAAHLDGRFDYRAVAKSLPSLPLLDQVMEASGSHRLMLFHQPFINQVAAHFPGADILLGKPMPVAAARDFYREPRAAGFDPARQLRWLLDTPARAAQYAALAADLGVSMQACVEIDIGLHRGGAASDAQVVAMLDAIGRSPHLRFGGFMGYEPHIVKVPGDPLVHRDRAMAHYRHLVDVARAHLGDAWPRDALLNSGGSTTYQLYDKGDYPCNELAAGSGLVKPTDFDLPTLADHTPAAWIAAPVLKRADGLHIPGVDVGFLQRLWNPNRARTFFLYGGYWKARPESPPGLLTNSLYGRSTNQEMLNGSGRVDLQPDDWVFLRPTQSEFVFLQFGDIAVYDGGRIDTRWPVFDGTGQSPGATAT